MPQRPRLARTAAFAVILSLLANLAGHAMLGAVFAQAQAAEATAGVDLVICTPSGLKKIESGPTDSDKPAQEQVRESRFCFFCQVMPGASTQPPHHSPLIRRAGIVRDLRAEPDIRPEPRDFVRPPARAPPHAPVFRLSNAPQPRERLGMPINSESS